MRATSASPADLIRAAAWAAELPLYLAFVLTTIWVLRSKDRQAIAWIFIALAVAILLEGFVAQVAFHPRPFAAGLGPAWVYHDPNNSMPSTHVTLAWAMALIALLRHQTLIAPLLFVTGGLMAWARIYVGIHWPADMVGAALSAGISVGLAWVGLRLLPRLTARL